MSRSYPVPATSIETEIAIKKSRFIARAARVTSRAGAMAFLEEARADYPDARHHCWAYLLGHPQSAGNAAMNDDGEPSGTAGKPILNVMQHKGIGDVMVVVSRYFGGIKLGAGGLIRAYAGATETALSRLPLTQWQPMVEVRLIVDFAREQAVRRWAEQHGARIGTAEYGQRVCLVLSLQEADLDKLQVFCQGRAIVLELSE